VRALVLALLLPVVASCAASRGTFASPHDYADYREFALSRELGERLATGWRYLRKHPHGEYKPEVGKWFFPAEEKFFTSAAHTIGGAMAYLELMPDGPHAIEAKRFVDAYEKERIEGPLREKRALEEARKKAESARKALGDAVEAWTRRALAIESWKEPRAALDGTKFGEEYNTKPAPVCDEDGCSKYYTFVYPVPDVSTAMDRTAILEVRLEITAKLLTAVTLVLPKRGFVLWLEGSEGRSVNTTDPNTRTESVVRARNRVESIVREVRGGSCTTDEEDLLRRITCGDVRVAIGTTPAGDDVVRIFSLK
jgi:hypothetical protein